MLIVGKVLGELKSKRLAERGRFELPEPVKVQQFSRLPQSTTLPPLRDNPLYQAMCGILCDEIVNAAKRENLASCLWVVNTLCGFDKRINEFFHIIELIVVRVTLLILLSIGAYTVVRKVEPPLPPEPVHMQSDSIHPARMVKVS